MNDSVRDKLERARRECTPIAFEAVRWDEGLDKGAVERICKGVAGVEQAIASALAQLDELEDFVEYAESKAERDDDYGAYLKLREFADAILGKQGDSDD